MMLSGEGGDDELYSNYKFNGGPGDDLLNGNGDDKQIFRGGGGEDRIKSTNRADDTIYARDGDHDTISCGGGEDTVYFDKGVDEVNPLACEHRIGE
jgi:Ca2+-binding RTX toxin-like protein